MIKTERQHRALIDTRAKSIGLNRTAHMILMCLARMDKAPSQKELAARHDITPAAVTGILNTLESDGYIERRAGHDSRYNEIFITEKGREEVMRAREIFRSLDTALFSGFTDSELEAYISMMTKMQENMQNYKNEEDAK